MQSTATAEALISNLVDKLSKRLALGATALNTIRQAKDTNGWPMIFISVAGNEAEAQPVLAVRISAAQSPSPDIFGNAQYALAPHICEIAYEIGATAGTSEVSLLDRTVCDYEIFKTSARIQVKAIANGTAVTATSMTAASPIIDLQDLYWPTKTV